MKEALAEAVRKLQPARSARLFPFARYRAIAIVHVVHYNKRASGARRVPTFKQFDGFRIEVRSRDHNPPHFHAIGSDFHALIRISDLQVMRGTISRKAYALAVSWAADHTADLLAEWSRLNERD